MSAKNTLGLLRQAESAWLDGDYSASTKALAIRAGTKPNFVRESAFDANALAPGVTSEPLYWRGEALPSHLVRVEDGIAVFDIGVPLTRDGIFMSGAFCHLKYPERYCHLFSEEAGQALKTAAQSDHFVTDAYVTLVRPPYYHWLMDTLPHLYAATRLAHVNEIKLIAPKTQPFEPWQRALLEKAAGAFGISNLSYLPLDGTAIGVRSAYSQTRLSLRDRLPLVRSIAPRTDDSKSPLYLYSRRSATDSRKLHQEGEVIEALGERFTVIDPGQLDLDTQMSLFSQARCVVGVHGSNLANIAFCQKGTVVVEIAAGLPQPHFEKLADAADLKFVRVNAHPINGDESQKTWVQAHSDLSVDPAAVTRAVDNALASTNP